MEMNALPPVARRSRWRRLFYDATYLTTMTAMTLGCSLRLEGRRRMPRSGPLLVVANHQSFLDPVLIGLAASRQLCFLGRKTLFRNAFFRWIIETLNAVPIDQEGIGIEGIRTVLAQLDRGEAVVVFPEGQRTPDGKLSELMPGIHLLVKRSQAPMIPVGIAGAFEAWPRFQPFPKLAPLFLPPEKGTLAVVVGNPIDGRRLAKMKRKQALDALSGELQTVFDRAERLRRR